MDKAILYSITALILLLTAFLLLPLGYPYFWVSLPLATSALFFLWRSDKIEEKAT